MKEDNPIDRKRNSAGHAEIGTKEDGTILEMVKVGKRLIVIKDKSIYEFFMADSIDPERKNINLPSNIQKMLFEQGAESEIVARTFLTAKTLFQADLYDESVDIEKALTLSLGLLQELLVLEQEINDYLLKEEKVSAEYESRKEQKLSYAIPSINDVETRCKTIFQKADHIEQILIEIATIFYPDQGLNKQSRMVSIYEMSKKNYGEEDSFSKLTAKTLDFMRLVREMRNGLDHRLSTVKVTDFELQADSNILTPTIELKHKSVKLEREALSAFLPVIVPNMLYIFENIVAHIGNKKSKKEIMSYTVREIPEEKRRYKHVKYCFWTPIGEGGYYNQ
ncbi:hypothetical protein J2X31_000884 [Flavobacterium arsenatis]|uniref:Uncharacterized protein n=1 Tax=Flavobacterium arsenatis TaxID=1484332 RepID=A0ABU1TLN6_9FLAO|nr:hypothetical protein [Flavobacterium arsenatis]MDR6966884.1 hypothetical protein [Flavobacterium arsenatis]